MDDVMRDGVSDGLRKVRVLMRVASRDCVRYILPLYLLW